MRPGVLFAVAASFLLAASTARAEEQGDTCVTAYEQAQVLKQKKELVRSKADLRLCTRVCPSALATDCTNWLNEVEKEIPTLVVSATSNDGQALTGVRVSIDGGPFVGAQSDAPIEVDPGRRRLVVENASGVRVELEITVTPGAKSQPITVRFPASAAKAPGGSGGPAPAYGARPVWALGLAGVGLVGMGVGGVLSIIGHMDRSELSSTCAPNCAQAQVDAIATKWVAGGITAGAGLALGALGAWLYFRPTHDSAAPTSAVSVTPLPGGGQISLRAVF